MPRTKITAYVPPGIAEALKRVAEIDDRSMSDVIEDAITRRLMDSGREAEHAAVVTQLARISRRLAGIELAQEAQFELTAQAARFAMSITPDTPDDQRAALSARGAERLRNLLSLIASKLAAGRGVLNQVMATHEVPRHPSHPASEAAE